MKYGLKLTTCVGGGWTATLTRQVNHSKYVNIRRADGKGSLSSFLKTGTTINLDAVLKNLVERHEKEITHAA